MSRLGIPKTEIEIPMSSQPVPDPFDFQAALEGLLALGMSESEALALLAIETGKSDGDIVLSDMEDPTLDPRVQGNVSVLEPILAPHKKVKEKR